ncbi:RidA family protein [Dyella sp. 2RAB6]|uniref:RidA family protein n=1 Tax=Dyella sp. 2RAB6 TaxID=3232992 RepID=UPI003F937C04
MFIRTACCLALVVSAGSAHAADVRYLNPAGLSKPTGYTHVVEVPAGARTLYLSGQIALDAKGNLVGAGDFAAQAEQVFANIDTALKASGASFRNVVKINMYVTDMTQLKALRAARDKYIDVQHPPASTLVEVNKLAREGLLLEVEATAVVP